MTGKRIFVILGFGILATGTLTAFWLMTLPAQHHTTSTLVADQRAEKERQRHEVIQQVAFKQQQLEERQLAEARRLTEQERQRREAERKQRQEEEDRRLADTVRALEKERQRQAEIVQASLKHRQDEESKAAEVRGLAELHRRETEPRVAAWQRQLEEERRLSEAVRQLEKERVRQAEVVQASMKQRLDIERRQVGAAMTPGSTKGRDAGVVEIGAKPAGPRAAKYRVASNNKAGRSRKCAKSCPTVSRRNRATGSRHARQRVPHTGESWGHLCPWRWFESVIAELIGPVRVAERTTTRRFS